MQKIWSVQFAAKRFPQLSALCYRNIPFAYLVHLANSPWSCRTQSKMRSALNSSRGSDRSVGCEKTCSQCALRKARHEKPFGLGVREKSGSSPATTKYFGKRGLPSCFKGHSCYRDGESVVANGRRLRRQHCRFDNQHPGRSRALVLKTAAAYQLLFEFCSRTQSSATTISSKHVGAFEIRIVTNPITIGRKNMVARFRILRFEVCE